MNASEIGCEDTVYKLVGFDPSGVRRVWAADYTEEGAREQCEQEVVEYVRGRPETGPVNRWTYEWR